MRLSDIRDSDFETMVAASRSIAGVLKAAGLRNSGGGYLAVRTRITEGKLDTSHFLGQGHHAGQKSWKRKTPEEILILREEGQRRYRRPRLLRALLESGVSYECAICQIFEWLGQELVLQIDHIDGNWRDDRIENLRFLCPNCHSQTETWGNKKRPSDSPGPTQVAVTQPTVVVEQLFCGCGAAIDKRSSKCGACAHLDLERTLWPDNDSLLKAVLSAGYSQTARELGVSGNAVKKRLKVRSLV